MANGLAEYRQLTEQEYADLASNLGLTTATVKYYFSSESRLFSFKVTDLKTIFKLLLPGTRSVGNKNDLIRVLAKKFIPPPQNPANEARPPSHSHSHFHNTPPSFYHQPAMTPAPAAPPAAAPFSEEAAATAASPFFEVVERLAVIPFIPKNDSRPFSSFSGVVDISEAVLSRVRPRTVANSAYQIQIRYFCNTADLQWLLESALKVNNVPVDMKPVYKKIKSSNKQPFIIPRLPDISPHVWVGRNRIEFVTFDRQPGTVIIQLVKNISIDEVAAKVPHNGQFSPKSAKKNSSIHDDELEELSALVTLRCPLICGRVEIPAKGRDCVHVACFDLKSYLLFASQQQVWHCPICQNKLPFKNLVIDDFVSSLIAATNSDTMQVRLEADGTYQPFDPDAIVNARKKQRAETAKPPTQLVVLEEEAPAPQPSRSVPAPAPASSFIPLPLAPLHPPPTYYSGLETVANALAAANGHSPDSEAESVVHAQSHMPPRSRSSSSPATRKRTTSNGAPPPPRTIGTSEDPFVVSNS